jgi:hypothetical protein
MRTACGVRRAAGYPHCSLRRRNPSALRRAHCHYAAGGVEELPASVLVRLKLEGGGVVVAIGDNRARCGFVVIGEAIQHQCPKRECD